MGRSKESYHAFLHRGLSSAGITKCSGPRVVIHKVTNAFPCVPDLPAFRQRIFIL